MGNGIKDFTAKLYHQDWLAPDIFARLTVWRFRDTIDQLTRLLSKCCRTQHRGGIPSRPPWRCGSRELAYFRTLFGRLPYRWWCRPSSRRLGRRPSKSRKRCPWIRALQLRKGLTWSWRLLIRLHTQRFTLYTLTQLNNILVWPLNMPLKSKSRNETNLVLCWSVSRRRLPWSAPWRHLGCSGRPCRWSPWRRCPRGRRLPRGSCDWSGCCPC